MWWRIQEAPGARALFAFVGVLMLTVLGGLAEFERELIRARTGEGRERAKARGVKMGRKQKLTPHQIREAVGRRDKGETVRDIARTYNVSHSTISRSGDQARVTCDAWPGGEKR